MRIATRLPGERTLAADDRDRIAHIRGALINIGNEWRARHPWLAAHQDDIGLTLFLISIAGVLGDAVLYAMGVVPWWATILLTAFWLSILHEIEHDLIHSMYYRNNRVMHNAMMFGVWFFRPSTINPWVRRRLHLHHHQVSGTDSDLEERAITNGEGWGAHRTVALLDSILGMYTKPMRIRHLVETYIEHEARTPEEARHLANMNRLAYFPLGLVHYGLWHLVIGLWLYQAFVRADPPPGPGRALLPRGHDPGAQHDPHLLPALRELEHALLRRRRTAQRTAADAGLDREVAQAVPRIVLQLR
jgi:hypothetical protein